MQVMHEGASVHGCGFSDLSGKSFLANECSVYVWSAAEIGVRIIYFWDSFSGFCDGCYLQ